MDILQRLDRDERRARLASRRSKRRPARHDSSETTGRVPVAEGGNKSSRRSAAPSPVNSPPKRRAAPKRHGLSRRNNGLRLYTAEQEHFIMVIINSGWSARGLAYELGVSHSTINDVIKRDAQTET